MTTDQPVAITSIGSHLHTSDHEVDLNAITSNPLSISEIGTTLTDVQKISY